MYKKISGLILLIALFFTTIFITNINGEEYSINDLIENGKSFDKTNIIITGEAIGEALNRGKYTWVNINDGTNAIGIYMSAEYANKVSSYGGYDKIGDTLEVKGVFNRACKEHGGDMDIHASGVIIKEKGENKPIDISLEKKVVLSVSTVILIIVGSVYYFKIKKSNK